MAELDLTEVRRPPDVQEQDFRLCVDFDLLNVQIDVLLEAHWGLAEDGQHEDSVHLGGVIALLEDIQKQRIAPPSGPN